MSVFVRTYSNIGVESPMWQAQAVVVNDIKKALGPDDIGAGLAQQMLGFANISINPNTSNGAMPSANKNDLWDRIYVVDLSHQAAIDEAEANGARGSESPGIDRILRSKPNAFALSEVGGSVTVVSLDRIISAIAKAGLDISDIHDQQKIQWVINEIITHELFHILGFPNEDDETRPIGSLMHASATFGKGLDDKITTWMLTDDIDKAAQEGASHSMTGARQ
jgi:hypothetical protein